MERVGLVGRGRGATLGAMAAALAANAAAVADERTALVANAAADERTELEPVGEFTDIVKEHDQEKTVALIKLVEDMNREMSRNESLGTFLLNLHETVKRFNKPVPRKALVQNGVTKRDLDKLVRIGFLKEAYLRHHKQGGLYVCVRLPDNVSFYGKQAVAVIQKEDVQEEAAAALLASLGGVQELETEAPDAENCTDV